MSSAKGNFTKASERWHWYAVPNLQIYLLICSAHQGDSHRQRWQAMAWPGGYLSPQSPWRPYEEVAYEECCPWPNRGWVPPRGPNTDRSVDGGSVSTRLIQQGKVHQEDSSRWLQVFCIVTLRNQRVPTFRLDIFGWYVLINLTKPCWSKTQFA